MGNEKRGFISHPARDARQCVGVVLVTVLFAVCTYSAEVVFDLSSEAARAKTAQTLKAEAQREKE